MGRWIRSMGGKEKGKDKVKKKKKRKAKNIKMATEERKKVKEGEKMIEK